MRDSSKNTITEITRRAIFKEMRLKNFPWWGDCSEVDLLGRIFDLESMESYDKRQSNAASDIAVHRNAYTDWDNDWIFDDERLNLKGCADATLLELFEQMTHPLTQPNSESVRWLVNTLNRHLVHDGWQLVKDSTISGRPIFSARNCDPSKASEFGSARYVTPDDVDIDLESSVYTVSRIFAQRGKTTEVAILADASAELTQIGYDNWDEGTYTYSLSLRVSPDLYARVAEDRAEFANAICEEIAPHFPNKRHLNEVILQSYQKAPQGWQERAMSWVGGKGVTNQGRVRSTNIAHREHDGLLFRSDPEINLYEALKKLGVAFAPLPVFLRGGESYQRLEPDFIVLKDGVFAVIEVDGDSFHTENPATAHTRLKLLENAGAYILRVNANSCSTSESAEASAEKILRDIATYKNNRR